MAQGYLAFVLHAHLPYVRHLGNEHYAEEKWLFEALTETYIPLYSIFKDLINDKVPFKVTLSISPTLLGMFNDELLKSKYLHHLDQLIELTEKEIYLTRNDKLMAENAEMYRGLLHNIKRTYQEELNFDLAMGFKKLAESGCIELITCGATHGYMPLMATVPKSARAQIQVGVESHIKTFGKAPKGFWLPECGYQPGFDEFLAEFGIKYFIVDTHAIEYASPKPRYGVFAPLYCPSGVAAFGRDMESSKQVWSAKEGYPGDFDYREFYRDIGFDRDYEYIKPYISPSGKRLQTGIKYFRITGPTEYKEPYVSHRATEKAALHAANFVFNREKQIEHLADIMDRKPIILAPYDCELFGHWWFEGPKWLDFVIRKVAFDQDVFELATPSQYLCEYPKNQVSTPSMSSWGYMGYSEVWLSPENDWIYRHLHVMSNSMEEMASDFRDTDSYLLKRALNQAARELLLAQSSDWAFIMQTGTCVDYAKMRTNKHIFNFLKLYNDIYGGNLDDFSLSQMENDDNIFSDIDYRIYAN